MQLRYDLMRTGRNGGWRRERFRSVTDGFPKRVVMLVTGRGECNEGFRSQIVIFAFRR